MSLITAPTVADLQEITEQVWSSYLDPEGSNPLIIEGESAAGAWGAGETVTASVSITGAWDGHVAVSCSEPASRRAAAALLMMDVDEVSQQDAVDALGELANIIGGNVKSILPSVCALSLPHVISGVGICNHWPAATQLCELIAMWSGEPVAIGVWQSKRERDGV